MKPRNCLALAVTSAFAIGCASAAAQEEVNPQPAPQQEEAREVPPQSAPADHLRLLALDERITDAQQRVADAETRARELRRDGILEANESLIRVVRSIEAAKADVDGLRKERDELHRRQSTLNSLPYFGGGPRRPGGAGPGGGVVGPDGRLLPGAHGVEQRLERLRRDELAAGPVRGPGPSVEQRLEQLERAVREMHAMFERHAVPSEARERAELEMRERREGGPAPGAGPEREPGPGSGPDRPREAGDGQRPQPPLPLRVVVQPSSARAKLEGLLRDSHAFKEMREMRRDVESAHQQVAAAHEQVETLRRQLEETQAALKKTHDELEELRARK